VVLLNEKTLNLTLNLVYGSSKFDAFAICWRAPQITHSKDLQTLDLLRIASRAFSELFGISFASIAHVNRCHQRFRRDAALCKREMVGTIKEAALRLGVRRDGAALSVGRIAPPTLSSSREGLPTVL
jgi:hypothetical protein